MRERHPVLTEFYEKRKARIKEHDDKYPIAAFIRGESLLLEAAADAFELDEDAIWKSVTESAERLLLVAKEKSLSVFPRYAKSDTRIS